MTIYKGHGYNDENGNHELNGCPKCMADMKVADGIAAETRAMEAGERKEDER